MSYHLIPVCWLLSKKRKTSVGKNVEKLERLCTADGDLRRCSFYGQLSMAVPEKKLNLELPYKPRIPLLDTQPKELEAEPQRDVCAPMFLTAFTTAKRWRQSRGHQGMVSKRQGGEPGTGFHTDET